MTPREFVRRSIRWLRYWPREMLTSSLDQPAAKCSECGHPMPDRKPAKDLLCYSCLSAITEI